MTRPSSDLFKSSSIQSSSRGIEAFWIFCAIFESEMSVQIEVGLTFAEFTMMVVTFKKRQDQAFRQLTSHFSVESFVTMLV